MGHICFRDKCDTSKRNGACRLNSSMHVVDPVVAEWVPTEPDMEVYNPDSFGTTSGENYYRQSDVGLNSYAEPHPDDLD